MTIAARPPGRSTRRTSRSPAIRSFRNCTEFAEHTASKLALSNGQRDRRREIEPQVRASEDGAIAATRVSHHLGRHVDCPRRDFRGRRLRAAARAPRPVRARAGARAHPDSRRRARAPMRLRAVLPTPSEDRRTRVDPSDARTADTVRGPEGLSAGHRGVLESSTEGAPKRCRHSHGQGRSHASTSRCS